MSDKLERPNYYGVLPADVRYDPDVTANAKILFAEITALANITGMCWATNKYFANLYGVLPNRISVWVRQLETKGFISTKVIGGGLRGISITRDPYAKTEPPLTQKRNHNNTSTNINNNTDSDESDQPPKQKTKKKEKPELQLFYLVVKKYGLPVINHNNLRKWAGQLGQMADGAPYLQQLLDKDLRTVEGDFRPTLNDAFDILNKKVKIQRFYNGGEDVKPIDPRVFGGKK